MNIFQFNITIQWNNETVFICIHNLWMCTRSSNVIWAQDSTAPCQQRSMSPEFQSVAHFLFHVYCLVCSLYKHTVTLQIHYSWIFLCYYYFCHPVSWPLIWRWMPALFDHQPANMILGLFFKKHCTLDLNSSAESGSLCPCVQTNVSLSDLSVLLHGLCSHSWRMTKNKGEKQPWVML